MYTYVTLPEGISPVWTLCGQTNLGLPGVQTLKHNSDDDDDDDHGIDYVAWSINLGEPSFNVLSKPANNTP